MDLLTKEKLEAMLPKGTNHKVTDEVMHLISNIEEDTGLLQDYIEDSILCYLPVLREVKVSLKDYINAVKFVTLKTNMDNNKAWAITFPDRYDRLIKAGKFNTSHVSMYNSNPLVTKIEAQRLLSYKAQYAPVFYQQIGVQARLASGEDANGKPTSGTVQQLASKTLLELLKPEETNKIDLTIGQSEEARSSMDKIHDTLTQIAIGQQKALQAGMKIEDIQKLKLTTTEEVIDV